MGLYSPWGSCHTSQCVLPLLSLSRGRNGRPQGWLLCFKVCREPCDRHVHLCPEPVALLPHTGVGSPSQTCCKCSVQYTQTLLNSNPFCKIFQFICVYFVFSQFLTSDLPHRNTATLRNIVNRIEQWSLSRVVTPLKFFSL